MVNATNGVFGVRAGVFYHGRDIPGLAMFEGTKHQYPLYDALATGVQMMAFTHLLGRTNAGGRTVIDTWAERRTKTLARAVASSVVSVIVLGNLLYGAVFAPHLVTKLNGDVTEGPRDRAVPRCAEPASPGWRGRWTVTNRTAGVRETTGIASSIGRS